MENYCLRNHIPISGPATREPCDGSETDLRVSIGFEPKWFNGKLGIEFSKDWHEDPMKRFETLETMRKYLSKEFPTVDNFKYKQNDKGYDDRSATLSGVFGATFVCMLYGIEPVYFKDDWCTTKDKLTREQIENLKPIDLYSNIAFQNLMSQMDLIEKEFGTVYGYMNWQGVLNNAMKIRGQEIFMDMYDDEEFVKFFFNHLHTTTMNAIKIVQERQRKSGFDIDLLSISDCVVNMISPEMYEQHVRPFDKATSELYPRFGIHTCNWNVTPYIDSLKEISKMGYIDMGMVSDMARVKEVFPNARRAVMYSPVDLDVKPIEMLEEDFLKIYNDIAPCDLVLADVQNITPNEKIREILNLCKKIEGTI